MYYWYVLVVIYISFEILLVDSGYLTSGTHDIQVSMDLWIHCYFVKPKGLSQKICLGNTDLEILLLILQFKSFIFPFLKVFL